MKRSFLFFIFIFLSIFSFSDIYYYKSNKVGVPIYEISFTRFSDFEYVISYEVKDNSTVKTLFKNGKEVNRVERVYESPSSFVETEYISGIIQAASTYSNNLLTREDIFFEGVLAEYREYRYRNDNLEKKLTKSPEGELLYTTNYLRGKNGRLVRVTNVYPDGKNTYSLYKFLNSELKTQIHEYDRYSFQYSYYLGKLKSFEERQDGELVFRREKLKDEIADVEEVDFLNDRTLKKIYDKENKLIKEITTFENGKIEVDYKYSDNNIIEKSIRSSARKELYLYEYDGDVLSKSSEYINDILIKTISYDSNDNYVETIYRGNKPFIKVYFEDNIEVKNELVFNKQDFEEDSIDKNEETEEIEKEELEKIEVEGNFEG